MNMEQTLSFLREITANNNRAWFAEHKNDYLAAREWFEQTVGEVITVISAFDPSVAHQTPKDCMYRFYRDTRFSPDKTPFKRHFGAYISARGRKSLHGGYYLHLQPGNCLLGGGVYWLPTNILTSVRNEIMGNIDAWLRVVEHRDFIRHFGHANASVWRDDKVDPKGFGIESLKKAPKGFPSDYEYLHYLKMKDYCVWQSISDHFFEESDWQERMVAVFRTAKPMMDFVNSVVDDYE